MRRAAGSVNPTAVKAAGDAPPSTPPRPPSPEAIARRLRFFDGLLVGVVLVFAFLTALFPVYNSDFFLHAAAGRLIAHGAYAFGADPFAFTTRGVYWVNHSWLYDLVVYLIYGESGAGGPVLVVLKALLIAALAEVMLRAARQPGRSLWVPAVCVGLALLALSPRLLLQPTCLSYLLLGLTYWLLRLPRQRRTPHPNPPPPGGREQNVLPPPPGGREQNVLPPPPGGREQNVLPLPPAGGGQGGGRIAPPSRPFLPYWLIPPLCLLWVNVDAWFLLGPITVALVLLGELLQDRLAPARQGPDAPAPGERRALALVLAASVAVCLVNPYHVRAFTLPSELGLSQAADVLGKDVQYSSLFLTPFDQRAFQARFGLVSVAGLAYYPLVLLGVASFAAALGRGRVRWPRVVMWVAFFALSAWHARSIPFFAVVGGPIAALNFLDFAAARRSRAAAPEAAAPQPAAGPWAFVGRGLTLATGVALVVATWPGWLQSTPDYRRVGCSVEPNRGLKEMADQVRAWRDDHRIEPDAHWFNTAPEAMHYLAWYCPGERGYLDQRLSLYDRAAADYLAVRNALSPVGAAAGGAAWRQTFRDQDVHYLVWSGPVSLPVLNASPLWRLFGSPKEWPLLYTNGHTSIFGWRDPAAPAEAKADPFARIEYDGDRAAFGPDAAPAPAGPTPAPRAREWWEALWTVEPPRPPEADEAAAQLVRFESLRPIWRARNEPVWEAHYADLKRGNQLEAVVGCLGPGGGYNVFRVPAVARVLTLFPDRPPPLPSFPYRRGEEQQYSLARAQFDFGPPSALHLSIRAARRALALKPDDATTYEALAQAYLMTRQQTREGDGAQALGYPLLIRQAQIAAALHRAIELDPDREAAHALSFQLYGDMNFLDLAADQDRERLRIRREEGVPEADLKVLADEVDGLDRAVEKQQTTYELRAAGKSDVDRAGVALQLHLGGKAVEVLEKVDWASLDKSDPNKSRGVELELSLLLRTGRAAEVAKTLADEEASLKNALGADPETRLPAYEWLRVEAAAATGDYAEADKWLQALQEKTGRPVALLQVLRQFGVLDDPALAQAPAPTLAALLMGHVILREAPLAVGGVWLLPNTRFGLLNVAGGQTAALLGLQSDLDAVRGWLALEAGHNAEARERLEAARDRAAGGAVPFAGRPLTRTCLELLDAGK